jgi:hypothetical protein
VRDEPAGIDQACPNIVTLEPGVTFKNRLGRIASRQHRQNMLDRQTATANDRFAAENPGIHGDSLEDFVFVHGWTQGDGEKSPLQRIGLGTLTSLRPRPTVMTGCRSRMIGGHAFVHSGTSRVRSSAFARDTLPGVVAATDINEDSIWLKGFHPDCLARFPEFPGVKD